MRTVTFKSILNGAAEKLGLDPSRDLNPVQATKLTGYINDELKIGWRWDFWPEWTVAQQRFYRDVYDATRNVAAGDERYFIGEQAYYQALRPQTPAAQAPATLSGSTYTENSAYWAKCAQSYTGNDWVTLTTYTVGSMVRNPGDGLMYQCHTAHVAGATFDATKFGALTSFNKYVGYEQSQQGVGLTPIDEVKGVSKKNPRVYPAKPGWLDFQPSDLGIQVATTAPNVVWVTFRLRPPEFNNTSYSATASYAVGDIRYYSTTGECYKAIQAGTGHLPTDTAYWTKIDFPAAIAAYVKWATFAHGLKDQKQTDRSVEELGEAKAELMEACDRALAQQGQYERAGVQTYGS